MKKINQTKFLQLSELQNYCKKKDIDYKSMEKLLDAERIKKLQKRNHYIQQNIDSEIEQSLGI